MVQAKRIAVGILAGSVGPLAGSLAGAMFYFWSTGNDPTLIYGRADGFFLRAVQLGLSAAAIVAICRWFHEERIAPIVLIVAGIAAFVILR